MEGDGNGRKSALGTTLLKSVLALVGLVVGAWACDNLIDEEGPFGPTQTTMLVSPSNVQLQPNGTQTFIATFGRDPITWSVSNTSLASIDPVSGVFTAGPTPGAVTVTALDSDGKTGTAAVTILGGAIILSPPNLTLNSPGTVTYTATGAVGTVFYSMSGASASFTGASISATGTVTVTTMPTTADGTQTLTITATDGIVTPGTAQLILIAQ